MDEGTLHTWQGIEAIFPIIQPLSIARASAASSVVIGVSRCRRPSSPTITNFIGWPPVAM